MLARMVRETRVTATVLSIPAIEDRRWPARGRLGLRLGQQQPDASNKRVRLLNRPRGFFERHGCREIIPCQPQLLHAIKRTPQLCGKPSRLDEMQSEARDQSAMGFVLILRGTDPSPRKGSYRSVDMA